MGNMEEAYITLIDLDHEDAKNAQDLDDDTTGDMYYTRLRCHLTAS